MSPKAIYLLVFSLKSLNSRKLNYWLRKIKAFIGDFPSPVLLVGSRLDQVSSEEMAPIESIVQNIQAKSYSFGLPIEWLFVSSKVGTNVARVRQWLFEKARNRQIFPAVPQYWQHIDDLAHDYLEKRRPKTKKGVLPPEDFDRLTIAELHSLPDVRADDRVDNAIQYHNKMGNLIICSDQSVIFNTRYLAGVFAALLSPSRQFSDGIVTRQNLFNFCWKAYDPAIRPLLLDLIQQFEIIMPHSRDPNLLIVPSLLPVKVPPLLVQYWPEKPPAGKFEVGRKFKLNVILKGLFPRVLYRSYHLGASYVREFLWRNGALFRQGDVLTLISLDPVAETIEVRTRGRNIGVAAKLFTQLLGIVEKVKDSYSFNPEDEEILVPYYDPRGDVVEIPYRRLLELYQAGLSVRLDTLIPDIVNTTVGQIRASELQVSRQLGRGGFGIVFEALYTPPDGEPEKVAVKQLLNNAEESLSEMTTSWAREVNAMSSLNHPNIDIPSTIVLEFIPGGDLSTSFHAFPAGPLMRQYKSLYAKKDSYRSAQGILSLMLQAKQSDEGFAEFQAAVRERRESTRWSLFHSVLQTPTQLSAPLQEELNKVRNYILRPSAVSKELLARLESTLSDSLSQSDSLSSQPLLSRLAELNTYEREALELSFEELRARLDDLQDKLAKVEADLQDLQPAIVKEDLALSFSLRVRCALDVAKGIRVMHSCSPPMVHNDIRSPNVFLVTLDEAAPIHAKLADFGLAREAIGNLQMKLGAWQWLAPEVLSGSTGFNIEADIYSFGIVMWELISGAGLNVPFSEFLSRPEILIRQAILKENLRPTISEYTRKSFEADPMFEPYTRLLYRCLSTAVRSRPTAHEVCAELHAMLGISDPDSHRYIPAVPAPRFELTHRALLAIVDTTPRVSAWTCSRCTAKNERDPDGFLPTHCRGCSLAQPPSRATPTTIALGPTHLYAGLKAGQVQIYARDHINRELGTKFTRPRPEASPLLLTFPSNRPVLRLMTVAKTVWAISDASELIVLNAEHQRLLTTTLPGPVTSLAQTSTRVFLAIPQNLPGKKSRSWIYVYTAHENRLELETVDYDGFITDLLITGDLLYVAAEKVSVYAFSTFLQGVQPLRSHDLPPGKFFTRMVALTPRHIAVLYDPFNLAVLDAQGFERLASIAFKHGVRTMEPLPDGTLLILTRTQLHYLPLLAAAPTQIPLPAGEFNQFLLQRGIANTYDLWVSDQSAAQIGQYHVVDLQRPVEETPGDLPEHWDQTDLPAVELGRVWVETLSSLVVSAPALLLQSATRLQLPALYHLYTTARAERLASGRPARALRQAPATWHSWAADLGVAGPGALNEVYLLLPYNEAAQVASNGLVPSSGALGEGFYLYDDISQHSRTTLLVVRVLLGSPLYLVAGQALPAEFDSVICTADGHPTVFFVQNTALLYPEFILECTHAMEW